MNFISKLRISRNPNCIDNFEEKQINEEVIEYAIEKGYKFNPETLHKFIKYHQYIQSFKEQKQILEYEKNRILLSRGGSLKEFFSEYCENDVNIFVQIIKSEDELAKIVIDRYKYMDGIININDFVQIIQEKEELIDIALDKYAYYEEMYKNDEFAKFITSKKSPKELLEKNISTFNKAFIENGNLEKIIELCENLEKEFLININDDLIKRLQCNIGDFIPYLRELDEIYKFKTRTSLINDEIKNKVIEYVKQNNIIYNEQIPEFVLKDDEYVFACLEQNPLIISEMTKNEIIFLNEDIIKKVAQKITEQNIKFEGIIPVEYMCEKEIFESIVRINPKLMEEPENLWTIWKFRNNMSDEEVVQYYNEMKIPFNYHTVDFDNFPLVLECVKRDYRLLERTEKVFKKEEYKQIYDVLKDNIQLEEVLNNEVLLQNPYFIKDLLNNEIELKEGIYKNLPYYEEFYPELKEIAIEKKIFIPTPQNYTGVIYFNSKDEVYIHLESLENVKKGLEYLLENKIEQDLIVELLDYQGQGAVDCECIISDNIEFFKELAKSGTNMRFKYRDGKKEFSLQQILESEQFMEQIVDEIKSKKFSPLEQLVAVYDITKNFKPYNSEKKRGGVPPDSRGLYEYLNNEYMVCAGYANLIANLGHRLNAPYSYISVGTKGGKHARNYVNIIDHKYGIDGYYVLDPTWETSGKLKGRDYRRSTYDKFLLTTEEGRKSPVKLDYMYDQFLDNLEKFGHSSYNLYLMKKQIKVLDPDFYKKMESMNLKNKENVERIMNYFKTKINNEVPKDKLLDAIMVVKRSIYKNFTEQDFEDMKNEYAFSSKFSQSSYKRSLYGDDRFKYLEDRYEEIKNKTIAQAKVERPLLNINEIVKLHEDDVLFDDKFLTKGYNEGNNYNHMFIIDRKEFVDLITEKNIQIQNLGFHLEDELVKICDEEEFEELDLYDESPESYILEFPEIAGDVSISERAKLLEAYKKELYIALGLESRTKQLAEQVIEEQKDTIGKRDIKREITEQINQRTVENTSKEHGMLRN